MYRRNYCQNLLDLHDYFKQNNNVSYKRTNYRIYTVFNKGISLWNFLDDKIKSTKTCFSFKRKAKSL